MTGAPPRSGGAVGRARVGEPLRITVVVSLNFSCHAIDAKQKWHGRDVRLGLRLIVKAMRVEGESHDHERYDDCEREGGAHNRPLIRYWREAPLLVLAVR